MLLFIGSLLNLFHSITFPAIIVTRSRAFAVPPTSRISGAPPGAPGLTMITKVHFVFVEELPGCLTY